MLRVPHCGLITSVTLATIFQPLAAWSLESVAVTEYMNHPQGSSTTDEWIEIYNYGDTALSLTGWSITDSDNDIANIPTGTTINAKDFLILARAKSGFESVWTSGLPESRIVEYLPSSPSVTFAQADTGPDEIILQNASHQTVWSLAYGSDSHRGRATFYALDDFSTTNTQHGTKAAPSVNRNGTDTASSLLDYEGNEFTEDPWGRAGAGGDFGSPLAGAYSGAHNPPAQPTNFTLNLSSPGIFINPGVRGLAIADQALNRGENSDKTAIIPSLERVTGSAIRGVAGGLYADMYDWKRRNDMPRPTSLEFQRWTRDTSSTLYVTANIRGLTEIDPAVPGYRRYYTSDTLTLANMAADWVRYSNHIVQTYRQGDTISNGRDASILSELTWNSAYVNPYGTADNFTTLLAPGELPVDPVTWWEIGNEPTVSLANAYSVTNGFTFTGDPAEYARRYSVITAAMIAEDPAIKVGPCVVNGRSGNNAAMLTAVLQSTATVNFISYHPYGSMGDWPTQPVRQQDYLAGVYSEQKQFLDEVKNLVALYRPTQSATMQYVASETNVSDFRTNNTFQEGTMAHALGSVETVMSFARLGLQAAHYWIWITATPTYLADSNRFAVSMAWEKMRDELGDELIGSFDANDKVHIYVIRDTQTGVIKVWALNFSNSSDIPFHFELNGGPASSITTIKKTVLQSIGGGPTNLFSANINPEINNDVIRRDVDWSSEATIENTDISNWSVVLSASTVTLFKIENTAPAKVKNWTLY